MMCINMELDLHESRQELLPPEYPLEPDPRCLTKRS